MESIKEYYKIINFRLENPLPKGTYTEKHHIKPKSIYPELAKDKNNIVKLLPEEHYKCHALLPNIYKELENEIGYRKMLFAWHYMAVNGKHTIDEQAEEYARLREEFRLVDSKANSGENAPWYGKHLSEETKQKLSESHLGKHHSEETKKKLSKAKSGKHLSEETKQKMSEAKSGENNPNYGKHGKDNPWYGKHHSEETREKISEANSGENHPMYGKHHSEETRKKISEAAKKRWEKRHQQKLTPVYNN